MKLPIQSASVARNASVQLMESKKMRLPINNSGENGIRPSQFISIGEQPPTRGPSQFISIGEQPPTAGRSTCGNLTGRTCWVNSLGNCVCSDVIASPPRAL